MTLLARTEGVRSSDAMMVADLGTALAADLDDIVDHVSLALLAVRTLGH